jgi:site-specific DNA-methyltransferase (cytosine-N4-specific)
MAGDNANKKIIDEVFYSDAVDMSELPDESVQLIVTSPPYFNVKDYAKDGYQDKKISKKVKGQIGDIGDYSQYIAAMLPVWQECFRVLKPNGKLVVNTPMMPMLKKVLNTHYNRHIFDINSDIQQSILGAIEGIYLLDVYIWNRSNPTKKLMFGSYPHPRNFYAQNTIEFLTVYVKDGAPQNGVAPEIKQRSKLTQAEWVEYTKQVWDIPIPSKADIAFGEHSAIMPEEIVRRFVKLFTFVDELVLDPFAGSGTTLKVAKELDRRYVGYEISESYRPVIEAKLGLKKSAKKTYAKT